MAFLRGRRGIVGGISAGLKLSDPASPTTGIMFTSTPAWAPIISLSFIITAKMSYFMDTMVPVPIWSISVPRINFALSF